MDIETYNKNSKVIEYCICLSIEDKIFEFYNTHNIIINVLNHIVNTLQNTKIEIYIHNLNFDGILIISNLSKNFIKYELISNKTNIYAIKIIYCNIIITLKCSYKIIPISLRTLGKIENFEKSYFPYKFVNEDNLNYIGEIPPKEYWEDNDREDFLKNNKEITYNLKNETIRYCTNDVILTKKVLTNLFKIIDSESKKIRKMGLSSPSISHKLFYKFYNNLSIEENIDLEYESYIRPSYFGGRTEVFGNLFEWEHIKYYDFSGMYAQCMLENFHYGNQKYEMCKKIEKPGFYNITYESNTHLPILPSHNKKKLMFLNGINTGTFWFEEINFFEENKGKILKINNGLTYENFGKTFENFVTKFTNLRKEGNYYNIFGKLMINGLYGSMALKHKEEVQYITFSEEEFYNIYKNTNVTDFYKIELCHILIIKNDYKAKNFFKNSKNLFNNSAKRNVSYASAIASKARIKLYKAMLETQLDGGRILYCDTDSIFASYNKNDKREKTKTFKWLDFYEDAVFAAPKTYAIKNNTTDIVKIKGINTKNILFTEFKKKFYNNNDLIFDNQLTFKKNEFNLKQLYSTKHIFINKYDKRKFSKDKKETYPIEATSLYD